MHKKKWNLIVAILMIVALVIVSGVWAGSYYFISRRYGIPEGAGTAGDMFGAVGALFSGWAFIGIIWAIILQRKSLEIQHDDFISSLKEMTQAREAHEQSAETLEKQVKTAQIQARIDIIKVFIDSYSSLPAGHSDIQCEIGERLNVYIRDLQEIYADVKKAAPSEAKIVETGA